MARGTLREPAALTRDAVASMLTEARTRTLLLIASVTERDLRIQHDTLMSPIIWDLGHIAQFEKLWLIDNLEGGISAGEMPGLYNPFEHPRSTRDRLPLPTMAECLELMAEVRRLVLESLEDLDLQDTDPLLREGFVFRMVAQHEYQHNETILQTLQLKSGEPYRAPRAIVPPAARAVERGMAHFPGGQVEIGTDDSSAAYDNERPRHTVTLPAFRMDIAPVSNADYIEFIEDGGYRRPELWTAEGRKWLEETGAEAPGYWFREGDTWHTRMFDRSGPVPPEHPVCHVCWYEADAYARWAGKRLPTEHEWEAAASWDPKLERKLAFPWGEEPPTERRANLDQLQFGTSPIGGYTGNVSPIGCVDMIGGVWEWTASEFRPWPGYRMFPYPEYSEVFFGPDFRVLRGGSWATRPGAIRSTFRNWDYPIRRQIFSGFRCASDA